MAKAKVPASSARKLAAGARAQAEALIATGSSGLASLSVDDVLEAYRALTHKLTATIADLAGALPADKRNHRELVESHRLASMLVEEALAPRVEMYERVRRATESLDELGPVSAVIVHAARAAADAVDLDRVLLSRIDGAQLVVDSLYSRIDPAQADADLLRLQASPVRLAYPLIEAEIVRRRRAAIIQVRDGDPAKRHANNTIMQRQWYVAAPIMLAGRAIGLFEGDRSSRPLPLTAIDCEALELFTHDFAQILEQSVLRRRLRIQRQEIRRIASLADFLTSDLSDGAIDLASDRTPHDGEETMLAQSASDAALQELLTRREIDVLKLMVRGETNAGIARALFVSEGTVKFHVKNVLRKMQASNRADATSRYLRLTLGSGTSETLDKRPSR